MADQRRSFAMGRGTRTTANQLRSKSMSSVGTGATETRVANGAPRKQLWPTNAVSSAGRDSAGYRSKDF